MILTLFFLSLLLTWSSKLYAPHFIFRADSTLFDHITFDIYKTDAKRAREILPPELAHILLYRNFLSKACFCSVTITFPGTKNCSGSGKLCRLALLHSKWWVWLPVMECRIMSALETCIWVHVPASYQEQPDLAFAWMIFSSVKKKRACHLLTLVCT